MIKILFYINACACIFGAFMFLARVGFLHGAIMWALLALSFAGTVFSGITAICFEEIIKK